MKTQKQKDAERYEYTCMINKLYKLNDEHKKEIYNLIQSYTKIEEVKNLTMTSKETNK